MLWSQFASLENPLKRMDFDGEEKKNSFLHPFSSLELVRNFFKRRYEEPEMPVRLPDFMLLKIPKSH